VVKQVIGNDRAPAWPEISGGRRHQQGRSAAREVDVRHAVVHALVPQRLPHAAAGKRLEGCRTDELGACGGQHDIDFGASLDQKAHQLSGLVGRDATGDAENDSPTLKFAHDIKIPPNGDQRGF
jgi:hypothetical protein